MDEIESSIAEFLGAADLLGDLPLTEADSDALAAHIRGRIEQEGVVPGTRRLRERAPCSVACFLVLRGIYGYREGDFWGSVEQAVGRPLPNARTDWGRILEEVLARYQLPPFADSGGHRYVTPILAHGGVPNYCLNDFFDRLLIPAVTGRLEYDGDVARLLAEWESRPALFQFADKPVRRFLQYGGKAAHNFLQRCLDMAADAIEGAVELDARQLGIPRRVVDRFQEWLRNRPERRVRRGSAHASLSRYRSPEVQLDLAAASLALIVPRQVFASESLRGCQPRLDVTADGSSLASELLRAFRQNGTVETEPIEIPLRKPFRRVEVFLNAGSERIKDWSYPGISDDCPWMAFESRSLRLITARPLPDRDFWLLSPETWEVCEADVREEALVWHGHRARRLELDAARDVALADRSGRSASVRIDPAASTQPRLAGGERLEWPSVACPGYDVYVGGVPELIVPSAHNGASAWNRLTVSVSASGESGFAPAANRGPVTAEEFAAEYSAPDHTLHVPLSDARLLGPDAVGLYTVRVRGRLTHDANFRVCALPGLQVELAAEDLIPDRNSGPKPVALRVTPPTVDQHALQANEHSLGQVDTRTLAAATLYTVHVPAEQASVNLQLSVTRDGATVVVPLDVSIPRVEWAVTGIGESAAVHYSGKTLEATLQELETADDPAIFVRGHLGRPVDANLVLGENEQCVRFTLGHGDKAVVSLKQFLDSVRAANTPTHRFRLVLNVPGAKSPATLDVLRVRTVWEVDRVDALTEVSGDRRRLYVWWLDRSTVTNRVLRLWRRIGTEHWSLQAEARVEDGRNTAEFEKLAADFPDGRYRIEFAVADDWETPGCPDAYARNIRDLEIRPNELQVQFFDAEMRRLDDFLDAVECGFPVADFFDKRIGRAFQSKPDVVRRFLTALHHRAQAARHTDEQTPSGRDLESGSIEVLQYVLTQSEEPGIVVMEAFASGLIVCGPIREVSDSQVFGQDCRSVQRPNGGCSRGSRGV